MWHKELLEVLTKGAQAVADKPSADERERLAVFFVDVLDASTRATQPPRHADRLLEALSEAIATRQEHAQQTRRKRRRRL